MPTAIEELADFQNTLCSCSGCRPTWRHTTLRQMLALTANALQEANHA